MKLKHNILTAALLLASPALMASTTWDLNGKQYTVDTLQHYKAGPATTVTVVEANGPVKLKVWYSVTDLSDSRVAVKSVNGSLIRSSNLTIPAMVDARKGDGNSYFLGVNADLFSTNGPIGTTICDGEILKTAKESTAWHAVGFEPSGELFMGSAVVTFAAKRNGKTEYAPSLVNVPRADNECIIYTRRWGTKTGTTAAAAGIEIAMRPEGGVLRSDGPTTCTVVGTAELNKGNMAIPDGCIVISSNIAKHISDKDFSGMKAGDTYVITPTSIGVKCDAYSAHSFKNPVEFIGGDPMLLYKGDFLSSYATMPNYDARRARTAIGADETHTKMTLLVVDGDSYNKGISAGVDAKDLAALMKAVGCYDALNFDGGGSSCFYNAPFGVMDRPSDGKNRAVRNGLFVTCANVGGTEMASIAFVDPHKTMKKGEKYTPNFYGYNNSDLIINTNLDGVTLSCPAALGTISADGKTLTVTGDGTYLLEARKGGFKATIAVRAGDYTANSGIDNVEVDTNLAPAEYYTLQGIRVENPESGVFICRQGNKVSKVIR